MTLPICSFKDVRQKYASDLCVICRENWQADDKVNQLACSHVFHNDCLISQAQCPLCMRAIEGRVRLNASPANEDWRFTEYLSNILQRDLPEIANVDHYDSELLKSRLESSTDQMLQWITAISEDELVSHLAASNECWEDLKEELLMVYEGLYRKGEITPIQWMYVRHFFESIFLNDSFLDRIHESQSLYVEQKLVKWSSLSREELKRKVQSMATGDLRMFALCVKKRNSFENELYYLIDREKSNRVSLKTVITVSVSVVYLITILAIGIFKRE